MILYSSRPCALPVPREPLLDRNAQPIIPSAEYESKVTSVKVKNDMSSASGSALRLPNAGLEGPWWLVGPWRFAHLRQHRSRPKDCFALTEPMGGLSAQFLSTHPSVRLHGTISTICFSTVRLHETISIHSPSRDYINPFAFTDYIRSFFFGPGLERKLTIWTDFLYACPRMGDIFRSFFLSTAERRLTAEHLDRFSARVTAHERHLSLSFYLPPSVGLLLTIWTRFSVRVYDRAWEAFSLPSIGLLEHFFERHHARATSEFAG